MAPTGHYQRTVRLLPLKPDYGESAIEYVEHSHEVTEDNVTEQVSKKVPILKTGSTASYTLLFFSDFDLCRRLMEWTTGPKLFAKFQQQLSGIHLTNWNKQIAGVNQTVPNFDAAVDKFKEKLLLGYDYGDQCDFLRNVRKPRDSSPSEFFLMLTAAEHDACQLPGAPDANPGFTEMERKRIIYNAMPYAWQQDFDKANMRIADERIEDMVFYFNGRQADDPYISSRSRTSNNYSNRQNRRNDHNRRDYRNVDSNRTNNRSNCNNNDRRRNSNNFSLETDTITADPESFPFDGSVQQVFETDVELDDDAPSTPSVPTSISRDAMVPSTLGIAKQINEQEGHFLMKALLAHGGSHVLVNRRCLPSDCELFPLDASNSFNTAAGGLSVGHYVFLRDFILPEFNFSRRVSVVKAFVFDNPTVLYDVILGRTFLNTCGIDVRSSDLTCRWYDDSIPFHPPDFFSNNDAIRTILEVPSGNVQE